MEVEKYICDLCGNEIENYRPNGSRMIDFMGGNNQVWPIENRDADVCASCCLILDKAHSLNMITIDKKPLYERAGFAQIADGIWERKQER